jgi:hypothetical protein
MTELTLFPGLDDATIGTYANEHGVIVPVYDINRIFTMFKAQNKSRDEAVEWISDVLGCWSEEIRPVFINLQPDLGSRIAAARRLQVN